jgi:hypothetical protein
VLRSPESRAVSSGDSSSAGFTMIELLIVVAVMPLVIGAIAVGVLSIFTLQGGVSNRLTDSGDAQLVSLNWQNDVQGAVSITTKSDPSVPGNPSIPGACLPAGSSEVSVLNLQLGNGSVISYGAAPSATEKNADDLFRNVCPAGATVPTTSTVLAHDVPLSVVNQDPTPPALPAVAITCAPSSVACAIGAGNAPAYQSAWVSTLGVTGVTFDVTAPESKYEYKVTAVPVTVANSLTLGSPTTATTGCGFATPNTGNSNLCFVDFSQWNSQSGTTCPSGGLAMTANVANTPFNLSFCMQVSAYLNGSPTVAITGPTSQGGRVGVNDITAIPFPTYSNPPTSESFLGNNGFYTGVGNDSALYEVDEGSTATVSITNISLTSNGQAATNWQLVTGDAESTDPGEWISWVSDQPLSLIDNSPNSPVGNACESQPPTFNAQELTGVGTTTVKCNGTQPADHTGTVMLQAQTPKTLTVTMDGSGLQGIFMGVLLQ